MSGSNGSFFMSVQFGRLNFDGGPTPQDYLAKVLDAVASYGPDGCNACSDGGATLIYRPFHTTRESRTETQPHRSSSGALITWDGRLDNRRALLKGLRDLLTEDSSDLAIVAAALDRWGTDCFARFIGDWAVAIVNPGSRAVTLAKDFIGTRSLYYVVAADHVAWSTVLDPLVLLYGGTSALCEEYLAGWFSFLPAAHLTPYTDIHSVPPSSFVLLKPERQYVRKYWDFDPARRIRCQTDVEYEDRFRTVFFEAVRRRLRCDSPILAELSGGMDSSSIVCAADSIRAGAGLETLPIDTVSYYDDSEPNWNERPYFSKVEQKRGQVGYHIDVSAQSFSRFDHSDDGVCPTLPGSGGGRSGITQQLINCMSLHGNRVVLSGIGGDEVTGGVPTPIPELEDLIARLRFASFAGRLKAWALQKRKPWFHVLLECLRPFLPPGWVGITKPRRPPLWLNREFVQRNRDALHGYPRRVKLWGALPSFQENVATLEELRRQLACAALSSEPLSEKRYPFLDRDLMEFIYAIPREQLVRPGQRRSLMRRALVGIVPEELLNRKRKAFVSRGPMTELSAEGPRLMAQCEHMISGSLGIVDTRRFRETLEQARQGMEVPTVKLLRTLEMERWLKTWKGWSDRWNDERDAAQYEANVLTLAGARNAASARIPGVGEGKPKFQPRQG